MGQALRKALPTSSGPGGGKLEYNDVNIKLFEEIVQFTESFPGTHPDESNLVFTKPMSWETKMDPSSFGSDGKYEQRGDDLVSKAETKDGKPLLRLHKDGGAYTLSVLTMAEMACVLSYAGGAGGNKLNEVKACLEANSDPLASIVGDSHASTDRVDDLSNYRLFEQSKDDEDDEEKKQKGLALRLSIFIKNFDIELLKTTVDVLKTQYYLDPDHVETQFNLMKSFSGEDEEVHLLENIEYKPDYKYKNKFRTEPKRQALGEIAYILVSPHDADVEEFYVVAKTSGFYEAEKNTDETNEGPFKLSETKYKELATLIKEKSPRFKELFEQKEFKSTEKTDKEKTLDPSNDKADRELQRRQEEVQFDDNDNEKKDKRSERKKKLEPSLKWKNLGLEETKEQEEKEKKKTEKKIAAQKKKTGRRSRSKAKTPQDEDSFSESSSESEEEEETLDRRTESNSDLPSEYWQIQKLVKYLKGGNQTATIIALCSMRDFNLAQETCQLAIRDVGGLEVLINLLDTDEIKCKIGSLKILKEISRNTQIRRAIADLGGLQTMVQILTDPNKQLRCLAAETIANVAKFRRARRTVRQHVGIKKLVTLLDTDTNRHPHHQVSQRELDQDIDVARCGSLALWSCSKSTKNKQAMRAAGSIPLLAKLLKSPHENMLIPVVGTLQECASEESYRLAIRTEGMIEDLVKNLKCENQELQMHCASAIFKCAEEKETRDLVRLYGGLDPLVNLLNNGENKELLAAATGAIWKCAISPENVTRFQELKAIDLLVALLNNQPEEVLVNVVGALGECAQEPANRPQIRKCGGISPLVNLLTGTNQALLVNVTKAVGACAEDFDNMNAIDRLDGVRLLWSLLKNQNPEVQASAAWAICPCIENAKDAGEMVRSFVGGLELIVSLLKSDDQEVLASVCAAIANIAKDEENLAVITDHGVVPMLAKLANTTDDKLRKNLAEAIARCCSWGNNRIAFGEHGAVRPLYFYLTSKDQAVHRSTAKALFQLSKNPDNCITMHEAGVVKPLMQMVGSSDEELQEAAAGCIGNIRKLALANEKAKFS